VSQKDNPGIHTKLISIIWDLLPLVHHLKHQAPTAEPEHPAAYLKN
jgi:hypothetical protein